MRRLPIFRSNLHGSLATFKSGVHEIMILLIWKKDSIIYFKDHLGVSVWGWLEDSDAEKENVRAPQDMTTLELLNESVYRR